MREYRTMNLRAAESADAMTVEGYAAVCNERTLIWESKLSGYKYYEIIERGAFDGADMTNVVMRYNHSDQNPLLARTTNGTLHLATDTHGLKVEADIADTSFGRDMYALIKRGDITQMSFGFTVAQESWDEDQDRKEVTRTIKRIGVVGDVSPVDVPAYDGTTIQARAEGGSEVFRKHEEERFLREKLIAETYL